MGGDTHLLVLPLANTVFTDNQMVKISKIKPSHTWTYPVTKTLSTSYPVTTTLSTSYPVTTTLSTS